MGESESGAPRSGSEAHGFFEAGDYVIVPFKAWAELPSEPVPLANGVWLVDSSNRLVDRVLARVCQLMSETPYDLLERPEDFTRRYALVVRVGSLPETQTYHGDGPLVAAPLSRYMGVSPVLRLVPTVERAIASLFLAGAADIEYSACIEVYYDEGVTEIVSYDSLGRQVPTRLGARADTRALTVALIHVARVICEAVATCAGGNRRPVVALDMFYHALLDADWRMRLLHMIIALEALFGTGSEVTHLMSERAASFTCVPGEARLRAYERLKKLYRNRSRLVHGEYADLPEEKLRGLYPELEFLEETVRASLLRILGSPEELARFCGSQHRLNGYLNEVVLAHPRAAT